MTNQEGTVDEEQIRLSGEAWAVVPRAPLTDEAAAAIGSGLRHAFPDKRFVVFGEPVDLVPMTTLDAAWKAAEAALPKGWAIKNLSARFYPVSRLTSMWVVEYVDDERWFRGDANGPTPTAALQALADRLSEGTPS